MKKVFLILLAVLISTYSHADSKFDKDLKKVSKHNGFVDSEGTIYPIEQISNKENTILIIYNHYRKIQRIRPLNKWFNFMEQNKRLQIIKNN